jgi:hypothetical protein
VVNNSFKDGLNNALEFNLNWFVSLVFLLGLLGISGTWLPFLFLLHLATCESLIRVSTGTNFAATISALACLVLLCLLVFYLGVLSSCIAVGISLSSACLGDSWPVRMACSSSCLI